VSVLVQRAGDIEGFGPRRNLVSYVALPTEVVRSRQVREIKQQQSHGKRHHPGELQGENGTASRKRVRHKQPPPVEPLAPVDSRSSDEDERDPKSQHDEHSSRLLSRRVRL
jgi:hypothetical protein